MASSSSIKSNRVPKKQSIRQQWERFNDRLLIVLVHKLPHWSDRLLRWLNRQQLGILILCLLWLFVPLITMRPAVWQQALVSITLIAIGTLFLRLEERKPESRTSEYIHLLLVVFSLIVTLRYLYYRTRYTLNFDTPLDTIFTLLLYLAELYAILTLGLAYFQTLRLRHRRPVDLTTVPESEWPTVDIYIPTYNEDVEIVRKTALGALSTDYSFEKKKVYILDDGRAEKYRERRAELRQMCEDLGCMMLTRDNNDHAKAGNINTALRRTSGDLVLILDCDHIPVRSILKETVGFFLDPKVAFVQTPHWFYNPDPFERNLLTEGQVPVGNELFYKVLQKGNDFWNAAFFCGSAAVIRREGLLEIGGIATETVTEDCHTALRLHSRGYRSVYYDKIMVAGLAPEKFSAYVGQQVRWARGMAQILRLENPLFNRKLKLNWGQRICYFSATSHFFFGFPRLMYAIAPVMFLLFNITSVKGLGLETLAYALPHIVLSMQTNHIPYKHVRFSFWNEIYEFAMSFQAGIVTLLALVNPKLGSFNVTDKGLVVNTRSFDLDSVRYLVALGALTAASLMAVPFWLIVSPTDTQPVLINAMWCIFNLVLVIAACLAAFEQPQLRRAHRMPRQVTAVIHSDDQTWTGKTVNLSETGAQVLLDEWPNIADSVRVELVGDFGARALLDARVMRAVGTEKLQVLLALDFVNVGRAQKDDLIVVLYSDVQQWYSQERTKADNPFESLKFITVSVKRAFQEFRPEFGVKMRKQVRAIAQLSWEGWGTDTYIGKIMEMGTQDLRLEIVGETLQDLDILQAERPAIALLVGRDETDPHLYSLLATIEEVELSTTNWGDFPVVKTTLELSFPPTLDKQQRSKIQQILRSFS